MYRNLLHFYTPIMKHHKGKSRNLSHLQLHQKTQKIPRNKPNQKEKGLYPENYIKFIKETEEDKKKWKNIPCSWIERTTTVEMCILSKAIYTFNAIPMHCYQNNNIIHRARTILKCVWDQKSQVA